MEGDCLMALEFISCLHAVCAFGEIWCSSSSSSSSEAGDGGVGGLKVRSSGSFMFMFALIWLSLCAVAISLLKGLTNLR